MPALQARPDAPQAGSPPRRADFAFMRGHLAHWLALGFGAGLAPRAPGTVGTLWAWGSFIVIDRWLDAAGWAVLIALSLLAGQWAATRTAQHLGVADPGSIVWDEVVAFWIVLWLLTPAPWWAQLGAFALFRYFDAAKPGPVRWADGLFKPHAGQAIGWRQGAGILLDDLVAAGCTLLFIALWIRLWNS
ncbi:MAG: phosphatidylglycerophosphatase A [Burkholderiales bacterium]|nr:phosphatidylglycerophosphatase A [Burkholderiales bacterium]